jgi:Amt family ammonium transporter
MVGKKNVISTMLQSFMAMIIVTILWVVIDLVYHLAHLLAALSVTLPNLFFQSVGPNTAWSLAQPYRFYYSLYSKLNSQ